MEENTENTNQISETPEISEIPTFRVRTSNKSNDQRLSSRITSSRKNRTEEERSPIVFGGGSRFNLPANVLKKLNDSGKVLGFVVYTSGNVDQKENYYDALDRGWKPLDAREYPELIRQYELSPFGTKEEDYLIRRGGQIAMIRDKEIDDAEKDYYDSEKQRQEYMASMYKQSDPRHPKPFIDERTNPRVRF
jgi:hypothetical protein